MAAVTSRLITIVKTALPKVSYFGNVTASLFTLAIVRKFTPRRSKTIQTNYSLYPIKVNGLVLSLQTKNQTECDNCFRTCEMNIYMQNKARRERKKEKKKAKKLHITSVSKNKA